MFIDDNECETNNGGCTPLLINTCYNQPGSFYCSCNKLGYNLLADNLTCSGYLNDANLFVLCWSVEHDRFSGMFILIIFLVLVKLTF